jgi:hypothetical protein
MAKTIDNLGIDDSTRYAQDQAAFDQKLVKEARVSLQARIDVTQVAYTSELDDLLELEKRHASWSQFNAPEGFYEQKGRLFTTLVVPSIGSLEKREAQMEKLQAMEMSGNGNFAYEKQIVLNLLKNLQTIDESLIDINDNRAQYQKG